MPRFADHFSERASDYARHRPRYPAELFAWLASQAPGHLLAWDCGTGNGQAAVELARYFERVVATDASAEQIAHAVPHERVEYRIERAEDVSLEAGSVALVTVAIAVHWFDLDSFYEAVRRVAAPGAVLAVWTYHLPVIEPAIDGVVRDYYTRVLAGCWPDRFAYVDQRYRTLPFPFEPLAAPELEMTADWDLDQLVGFLDSWSATRRYREERGQHPVSVIWGDLVAAWGEAALRRPVRWPLHLRAGRVGPAQ